MTVKAPTCHFLKYLPTFIILSLFQFSEFVNTYSNSPGRQIIVNVQDQTPQNTVSSKYVQQIHIDIVDIDQYRISRRWLVKLK